MTTLKYKTESKYYLIWEDVKTGYTENHDYQEIAYSDGNVWRVLANVDKTYYGWGCQIYNSTDRYSYVRKITKEEIQSAGFKKFICILKSLLTIKKAYNLDSSLCGIPVKNEKNLNLYKKGTIILYKHGCTQQYNNL